MSIGSDGYSIATACIHLKPKGTSSIQIRFRNNACYVCLDFFYAFPKCSINTIGLRHTKSRFNSLQSETQNTRIRHFLHDLAI